MPSSAILWPILAHIALVFALYAALTIARARAVAAGAVTYASFEFSRDEPPRVARITRNLANQFELPVLFYAVLLLLMQFGALGGWDVAFAWVFVAGRVAHTAVQTGTDNVPLRGQVFVVNSAACAALVAHLVWVAIQHP